MERAVMAVRQTEHVTCSGGSSSSSSSSSGSSCSSAPCQAGTHDVGGGGEGGDKLRVRA